MPPKKGRPSGRQKTVEANHGVHVDLVHVGTLFAVDLDADEVAVHESRRRLVLKRFAFHYVAPMTGAVADGDQKRSVLLPSALQGFPSPGIPVHRVVAVLKQVGARFRGQPVFGGAVGRGG